MIKVKPTAFRFVYGIVMIAVGLALHLEPEAGSFRFVLLVWRDVWGIPITAEFIADTFILGGAAMTVFANTPSSVAFLFSVPYFIYGVSLVFARLFVSNVPLIPIMAFLGLFIVKEAHTWDAEQNG